MKKFAHFLLIFFLALFATNVSSQEIEQSIFVTGNTWDTTDTEVLSAISKETKLVKKPTVLIIGNAAPKTEIENSIDKQVSVLSNLGNDVIFISGNKEWANGNQGVSDIEKYIQKKSKAKFSPDDAEPIKHHDLGENVELITVDSQWFLEDWDDHVYINEDSEIQNRTLFFLEFENRIKKAQGKIILVAMYHPIETNNKQGLFKNVGGFSSQDFQNKQYRTLRNRLKTTARGAENVIFLSGQGKNLQYIKGSVPQINSGAAGNLEAVRNGEEGDFSLKKNGYVRLDITTGGEVIAHYQTFENGTTKEVFKTTVLKGDGDHTESYTFKKNYPRTQLASIYTKKAATKSGFYKALWGEHYRDFYGKEVNAPVVLLDTLMGGLTPVKRGGGQQSKSLRLVDKTGKQYVMRALKKSTIKFLQANAFQETYVGDVLDGTVVDKFLADFYTTSNPYTPFAIGSLSTKVGVNHTNPILYYIPKQQVLGNYNDDFGDELYMIEEHVGDTQIESESFGKPVNILSTADVLQEINKSGKSVVDEPSYIRARLFDMLLGDWDRHEDQWRWALYKNDDGTEYCSPIPRDRDQAFSKYDGTLISTLTRLIPGLRKMQTYDEELRSVKWFASSPYHLDLTLIHASGWEEWEKQTSHIQNQLTNADIEKAFQTIPEEVKGPVIEDIKVKLQGRRDNLMKIAKAYYLYLNKFQVVTGTQKADDFTITRLPNGKTSLKIDRKDLGILNHTYSKDITKEIWLFGLDGKDTFTVEGEGDHPIKIKIVGGKKNDTYDFKNIRKVKLYDYKDKENTIVNKQSKKWLVNDYGLNNYDHKKVKYNFNQLLPIIAVNPDDGLKIGVVSNHTSYSLQRNPFTYKHSIHAAFYTSTSGYDLSYDGEFSNIFHNWNFGIEGLYTSPNFSENFFGFGNDTEYDNDEVDLDFNRVRIRKFKAALALKWEGISGGSFYFKPLIESFNVENIQDRFVSQLPVNSTVFDRQTYGGIEAAYNFENKNSSAFPTLGLDAGLTLGYKTNIDNTEAENSFAYLQPHLAVNHKLIKNGRIVLATELGGEVLIGDDFEFYHAATIGGNKSLRGFRNERFTGKQSFYQNTDLRFPLGGVRTSLVPFRFGVTGSFDYGRVWTENDSSNTWHNSIGGSIWLIGAEAFTTNLGYFSSADGGRVVFTLGFAF
ncbi:metallophosphatase [Zobellia nedashkovskayae]|uniref:metallophosphatase n=1 Tax=Zobellia nedashkovskayae TaxID=2779510 RepID=UPI00188A4773|nr:metallophosphatase [Zobellia nedashkovskayae]